MQNNFNKYGEYNFKFEIIEECVKNDVDEREKYWIEFFKSNQKEFGFNSESGGSKFKTLSEEHKRKISIKVKGKNNPMYGVIRKGKDGTFYGKHLSEEAKKIISDKAKQRYHTHSKYINSKEAIDKRSISNTGKKRSDAFRNRMREIAKSRTGEKNAFYGRTHSEEAKGKISKANKNNPNIGRHKRKMVKAINLTNGEESIFESISDVTKSIPGLANRNMISGVIKGTYKQYKGYTFEELR